MDSYKTGEPIYVNMPVGYFEIQDINTDTLLYSGSIYSPTGATSVKVDMAPVIRQLVPVPDYRSLLDGSAQTAADERAREFVIYTDLDKPSPTIVAQFLVRWNYSPNPLPIGIYGGGVQDYVYAGQPFPINSRNEVEYEDPNYDVLLYYYAAPDSRARGGCAKYLAIRTTMGDERRYRVRDCAPPNAVTLYYVDREGALSWVHCDRKNVAKQNITRSQITRANQIDKPTHFGIDNYHVETYLSFTLNTGYLSDGESRRIQDLFTSPKVWLYDYAEQKYMSVVITDTSNDVKNKSNSGTLFNYTIKCRQSQTYEIVA